MTKYVVLGVLIVGVGLVSYMGCDGAKARFGVASDKAIEKIDDLLGKINVEQKKVENAYADLEEMMDGIREKRIEAQVRVENLKEKRKEMTEKEAKLKNNLSRLRDMLNDAKESGSIERNGNQVSVEQLKLLAEGAVKEMKAVRDQLTKNTVISNAWAKNLTLLSNQEETSQQQLKKLSNQLDEIRSKKSALDAMKEAASIAGPGASVSDKFNDLTASVDELLINIDTEFKIEEAKLDERAAELTDPTVDLDALLDDKTNVEGTLSDIDALLGDDGE